MARSIRRYLFFFLSALIIFYILFVAIPNQNRDLGNYWPLIVIYAAGIGFMVYNYYREEEMEEVVGEYQHLKRNIEKSRFTIIEERDNSFLLKPRFDYPYSLFNGDRVRVNYLDNKAIVIGPKYYVEGLVKDIRGEMNFLTRILSGISISILLFIIAIYPLLPLIETDWNFP